MRHESFVYVYKNHNSHGRSAHKRYIFFGKSRNLHIKSIRLHKIGLFLVWPAHWQTVFGLPWVFSGVCAFAAASQNVKKLKWNFDHVYCCENENQEHPKMITELILSSIIIGRNEMRTEHNANREEKGCVCFEHSTQRSASQSSRRHWMSKSSGEQVGGVLLLQQFVRHICQGTERGGAAVLGKRDTPQGKFSRLVAWTLATLAQFIYVVLQLRFRLKECYFPSIRSSAFFIDLCGKRNCC